MLPLLFHQLKDSHYANNEIHQDNQDQLFQNKPIGLSLKLKSFESTQISISVGRSYIIEYPYKLLASKYMIHEVGLLISYDFKDLLLASA